VREQVSVNLLKQDAQRQGAETYVPALSSGRRDTERAMRRRRLKRLWKRLHELQQQRPTRDQLLLKLGAAKKEAGRAYGLVKVRLPRKNEAVTAETFTFTLNRKKLRLTRRREGHYVLRTNLTNNNPAQLWAYYTSYRHKLTFLECLKIQCEQRFQLLFVRCVCLVKAISNGVSEFGEIGVVFRVKNLFLNEFPEPFDEVQVG